MAYCRLVVSYHNSAYRLMDVATQVVVTCDVNVCVYSYDGMNCMIYLEFVCLFI